MNERRYRYTYRMDRALGQWTHIWALVGARGAVHLSITAYRDSDGNERMHGGVEVHRRYPDGDDGPPDHDECWLLKGPCWHDGSSLMAEERYIPQFKDDPHDHEGMFLRLTRLADEQLRGVVEP